MTQGFSAEVGTGSAVRKSDKGNVPKLRFPEFEGEWEEKRLEEIATVNRGKFSIRPRNDPKYFGGSMPFVQTGDVVNASRYLQTFTQTLNEDGVKVSRVFPAQTILITIAANIGDVAITSFPVACPDSLVAINTKTASSLDFVFDYLTTRKEELESYATTNAQANINLQILNPLKIPQPTLPEQKKIAAFLGAVDEKLTALRKRRDLLAAYKRGAMQQIFTQKIRFTRTGSVSNESGNRFRGSETRPENDGGSFPDWEEKRLGDWVEVNSTPAPIPERFLYIALESVEDGRLVEASAVAKTEAPSRAQRSVEDGDVLFQTVRPYQRNNLYFDRGEGYVASTGYALLRNPQLSKLIYQLVHTNKFVSKVLTRCTGTSYPAINSNDLADIEVQLPPHPEEQQKIADFLSALDTKIDAVTAQITQTEAFKKGLLQQMFV